MKKSSIYLCARNNFQRDETKCSS